MEKVPSGIDFAGKLSKASKDRIVNGSPSLSNLARKRDQILGTPSQDHGSIHVVVEWGIFEEFLDKL